MRRPCLLQIPSQPVQSKGSDLHYLKPHLNLPSRFALACAIPAGVAILVTACLPHSKPVATAVGTSSAPSPVPNYGEVYGRASNTFGAVLFFKPAEGSNTDLILRFAPLLLQEVGDTNQPGALRQDSIGSLDALGPSSRSPLVQPAIYALTDTVEIRGRAHLRLTYLWCYAPGPGQAKGTPVQCIRLTLNSAAEPAVWEVLAEESPAQLIFVSSSVESAARAQYGAPLPGRRFAVERTPAEAPRVVVARVIDDGPTAMGPIVYLRAGTRSVSTLTCRCMPAQAKRVLTTTVYRLVPVQQFSENPDWTAISARDKNRLAFHPGSDPGVPRLDRCLRLPALF